jgi:hypothetical protein
MDPLPQMFHGSLILSKVMKRFPGLVVNTGDLQSEPWSFDVSSIPGVGLKTRWIKWTT